MVCGLQKALTVSPRIDINGTTEWPALSSKQSMKRQIVINKETKVETRKKKFLFHSEKPISTSKYLALVPI